MANTLGSLVVKLGLDAAEFTSGLTASEYQAQKFARKIDQQLATAGRVLATGLLAAGGAALIMAKNVIADASALDDLADATGSSVESLSKLANQAKISGRDFGELQGLVLKLSAGMAGADDESSKTGRALAALGVTAKDPAEALQQVAVELNKYADGVGKAALARDLFGKGGPAFIAVLKDMAESQDVVATTTAKMAADAEALEKAIRRLGVEGTTFKNIILGELVPWLNTMLEQFNEGIRVAGGFRAALVALGNINPFKSAAENIADFNRRLDALKTGGTLEAFNARVFGTTGTLTQQLTAAREFEKFRQRQEAMAGAAALGYTGDVRDYLATKKPALNYTGAAAGGGGKAAVDKITEAERYLKALQEQLDKTRELTVYDRVLNDLLSGRLELAKGITSQELLGLAQQIDAANATKKQLEEEARIREQTSRATLRLLEAQDAERSQLAAGNEALRNEIALIGADAKKREELALAVNAVAIAKKEEALADELRNNGASAMTIVLQEEINLLRERAGLLMRKGIAESAVEEAKKAKEFVDSLGLAFSSAFEDAIVAGKGLQEVLKGLEQDIVRIVTRKLVTEPLANSISQMLGGAGLGGLGSGNLGGFFGSLFGGGASVNRLDPLGFFGIPGFAAGTNYAPGGLAKVGEFGPEIVNLPKGAQVIPISSARSMGKSLSINQQINVLPGASRQSATQAAAAAAREARIAAIRNG